MAMQRCWAVFGLGNDWSCCWGDGEVREGTEGRLGWEESVEELNESD